MSARRPLLLPLVPLYRAGLRWKNARFDGGEMVVRRLREPVISVGSLSAGGAGKTPFLIALAGLLRGMGYEPDVLSRGYGRRDRAVRRVEAGDTAEAVGDEPLLLARVLECAVFVGAERFAAGRLAEKGSENRERGIHLLDDGFGHRRLDRTIDIVLLTNEDVRDTLLPAGNLREEIGSLGRAQIVVLREGEASTLMPLLKIVFAHAKYPAVWTIRRDPVLPGTLPKRPLVFCGIARPLDFEAGLRRCGIAVAALRTFRDHHRYTMADAEALRRRARTLGADGFITTAKDAVKLDDALRCALEEVGPVAVADVAVTLQDEEQCRNDLKRLLP